MSAPAEPHRRGLLPPLAADVAAAVLAPPRLPASALPAVALARQAAALAVPVRLEAPAGRTLLARALHTVGGRPGPLVVAEGRCGALAHLPAGASVLVDVATLTVPGASALEALLDDGAAWLLLGTGPGDALPAALAPRLATVALRVPPLCERGADLAALAQHLLAALSARRAAPAPPLTADAVAHLAARPWPGDVPELEAALAQALLRAGDGPISARHLVDAPAAPPAAAPDGRRAQLEYLVAELAHELRNPLTAIKTFAHLPALSDDAALRACFATLADDAIARMDHLLDNVVAFARLGAPEPAPVELAPLLDALLAEVRPALAERAVAIDYVPAYGAPRSVDREQLAYALRNLLAGVAREAPEQDTVRIDAAAPGLLRVAFTDRHGTADRLRRLVLADRGLDPDDRTLLPLSFTLARAVLERNGGALAVRAEPNGRATLEVRLPDGHTNGG